MLLREQIYGELKRQIIWGDLQPGARLRYAEIAEQMQVSRTPVREALRQLEDERYVKTFASRWTEVTAVDPGDAKRMYPIRWALEAVAVRTSPPLGASQIERLRFANAALAETLETGDWAATHETDLRFHDAVVAPADNPELSRMIEEVHDRLLRCARLYWDGSRIATESVAEHEQVIDLLAAGDHESAADAITAHWQNSLERFSARAQETGVDGQQAKARTTVAGAAST